MAISDYSQVRGGHGGGYQQHTGDFNGDGITDAALVHWSPGYGWQIMTSLSQAQRYALTHIFSGLGAEIMIGYKPITDPSVYRKSGDAVYPNQHFQGSLYVVSKVQESDASGGLKDVDYTYTGAKANVRGRGFLGFASQTVIDALTKVSTTTSYHQGFPYIGLMTKTETELSTTGRLLSSVVNTYASRATIPGVAADPIFPYLKTGTQKTYDLDSGALIFTTTTANNVVDEYGNLKGIEVEVTQDTAVHTTRTVNTYDNDATNWRLGRLRLSRITLKLPR